MKKKIENQEIIETPAIKENKFKNVWAKIGSFFTKFKSKKIRNQALFKRGGYSLIITAVVLVGLIAVNWLSASLSDRFNLEFDMTTDKKNSIDPQNVDFIQKLDTDVNITIIGTENEFVNIMAEYAYYRYGIDANTDTTAVEYFNQTLTLIDKYTDYSDKITVGFIDPQTTEFTAIENKYADENLMYGSMIVTSGKDDQERVKVLNFDDIYVVSEGNSMYGQAGSLSGNNIETALTTAIAKVTSKNDKKVALLKGHSPNNGATAYRQLLELNNYEIDVIEDLPINTISSDYDAIIISGPTIDFTTSEIDVITAFLENGGKKGKGLIFFADAASKPLTNLYNFLKQWGIEINEGILFETDSYFMPSAEDPSTVVMAPQKFEDDTITETISTATVADRVAPMKVCEDSSLQREAKALMFTTESIVVAPIGAEATWSDPEAKKQSYDTVIQSVETNYGKDNAEYTSYIMAFASYNITESDWAAQGALSNQNIVMACTDRAAHLANVKKTFTYKVLDQQSFADQIVVSDIELIRNIFVIALPLLLVAVGIVIFVRRRNAR